ncbi:glycogen synthase [candidate division CSSED10-310 bacterium]|uniref:Glycogen synthase n=1 Tax=candidate division CSSED10-310 bacterium TaxID=2855610 RepID=A0ABV6YVD7_UNCC1
MKNRLRILMVASEMVPFAKAGGLADVLGALPIELKKFGHDVRVIIPKYSSVNDRIHSVELFKRFVGVPLGNEEEWCAIYRTHIREDVPVYFVDHNWFYLREGIYHDNYMNDYQDNPRRFGFLSKVALQFCKEISFKPDVIHVHDWPTAVIPAFLKTLLSDDPDLAGSASLLTAHNLMHQGIYPRDNFPLLDLEWRYFHDDVFKSYDSINLLKGGIYFADLVNTVSPGYAKTVLDPVDSTGLAPYLAQKGYNFVGVLNGVDYDVWSPEKDTFIPAQYSMQDRRGKVICKRDLQKTFLLDQDEQIALIGVIGRFVPQKGFHLLAQVIQKIVTDMHIQFVILGTGDNDLENYFMSLPATFPARVGYHLGFNDELAHLIEAGSDFFLMPSLFEPCGLNQIYSLRYGTLPIVRATGGLDDTIINYDELTGEGTGFKFFDASAQALYYTVGWAISTYYDRPAHLEQMIQQAMAQDFSWQKSAQDYNRLYQVAILNHRNWMLGNRI